MRVYELIFILKPDLPDEEIDAAVEQVQSTLTEGGANIDKTDRWGKRRLAYMIKNCREGYYVLIQYSLGGGKGCPGQGDRAPLARLRLRDQVPNDPYRS